MTQTPAGWYPQGDSERYWDGSQWTEQRRPFQVPQQAYPPQPTYQSGPAYQPGPPPKKSHTARNVLIAFAVLFVVFVGGCFAVLALAANKVDNVVNDQIASNQAPGGPDNPLTIVEGKAFGVSGFEYAAGWSVSQGASGLIEVTDLKLTNNRDKSDVAIVEIKFWNGQEVLALTDCATEPIAIHTTVTIACFSGDSLPASYDRITINDAF